jgi:HSP90 family molecular chaperone
METTAESHKFQAETKALLHLMTRSLYSDRELFLRELISNASDALDRLRFESLANSDVPEGNDKFEIRLEVDRAARTLIVTDTGIGMTRD